MPRAGIDSKAIGRAQGHPFRRPLGHGRHADTEARFFKDVLERPGAVFDHGQLASVESCLGAHVVHVREGGHHLVVPHAGPHPLKGRQCLGTIDDALGRIVGIHDVAAPGVDVDLQPVPTDVEHAAPDVGRAVAVRVVSQLLHCREVVVVGPGSVGVGHPVLVEDVFVVIEDEGALILRHTELAPARVEEGLVLDRIPVGDYGRVQVGLHVRAQVEHIAFLIPRGEELTAALEDIGCVACLHVERHLVGEVLRIRRVEDAEVRMSRLEDRQLPLSHRREPLGPPVLVDELHPLLR